MSRAVQRLVVAVLAGLVWGWRPLPAGAQGREVDLPVQPFALRDVGGWIEFEYEDEEEERIAGTGSLDRSEDRMEFSETVRIDTRSYIYHPYLADIHFSIEARAKQGNRDFSPSSVAVSEDRDFFADTILADVTLLKQKPVVTHAFFRRQVQEVDLDTLGGFEVDRNAYGLDALFRIPDWPTSIVASRTTIEGRGAAPDDEEDLDLRLTTSNRGERLTTNLLVGYEDRQDHFRDRDTDLLRAELRNQATFGDANQHAWSNYVRYGDQGGSFTREEILVREEATIALTDRWSVQGGVNYGSVDFEADTLETWSGRGALQHRLYDSLTSVAQVEVVDAASDLTEHRTYREGLTFNYRKQIPGGVLQVGLHGTLAQTEEESTGTTQLVADESHTFGGGPILLNNPNVVAGSVVVTDTTGVITYVEGLDYLLLPRGLLLEVVRLGAGGIPSTGTILMDYQFLVSRELAYEALSLGVNARVSLWNWLTLYGAHDMTDTEVTRGEALSRIQDREDSVVGAEISARDLTLTGELERFDSGLTAYDRQHARLAYTAALNQAWQAFGNAAWTRTEHEVGDEDITAIQLRGGVRGRLYGRLQGEVDAWLRTEDGRKFSPDTDERGVRLKFVWSYRQVQARLSFVHALREDTAGQKQERQAVSVSVRRWF